MINRFIIVLYLFLSVITFAQLNNDTIKVANPDSIRDTTKQKPLFVLPENLKLNAVIETYYAWDTDEDRYLRQYWLSSPYRDEFRLGLVQVSASYIDKHVRGKLSIHFGDVPNISWPGIGTLKNIQEAYAGFSPGSNLWFDFGYFINSIGAESVFPHKNIFTTTSITTLYKPLYQSGIRISYNRGLFYSQMNIVNGYNQLTDNNRNKSAGLQLGLKKDNSFDIAYSNFLGNEQPEFQTGKLRFFNNLFMKYFPGRKVELILNGDLAIQEKSAIKDTLNDALMYAAYLTIKIKPFNFLSFSVRGEYFSDEDGFLSGKFTNSDDEKTGLTAYAFTLGFEFKPASFAFLRIEERSIIARNKQKVFFDNNNSRFEIIFSSGIEF